MELERRWYDRCRRFLVVTTVAAGIVTAGEVAAEGTPGLPVEGVPSSGCKELGEVVGTHFDASPQMGAAKESALKDARDLGATHVQVIPEKTYQSGAYEVTYTGIAFRCPAQDAPAPGR
jgi:hypothetical protein